GSVSGAHLPMLQRDGLVSPRSILAVGGNIVVAKQYVGRYKLIDYVWYLGDVCSGETTYLGQVTGEAYSLYFIPPLAEPPIAIDSSGVFVNDRRAVFTQIHSCPSSYPRRRAM